jgi:hypothetical protein
MPSMLFQPELLKEFEADATLALQQKKAAAHTTAAALSQSKYWKWHDCNC